MQALTRKVKYYDLHVTQSIFRKKDLTLTSPHPLKDFLIDLSKNLDVLPAASITDSAETYSYRFDDISIEGDKACLLFTLSNGREADQTIQYIKDKNKSRQANKTKNEGNSYSGHLCINLVSINKGVYQCIFEDVPNLPMSIVDRLLSRAGKELAKKETPTTSIPNPDDPNKKLTISYKFASRGHPNETLQKMLADGEITSFEIIDEADKVEHWDSNKLVQTKRYSIKLSADLEKVNASFISKMSVVKDLCNKAVANKLDQVRIGYKSPEGDNTTLAIDPSTVEIGIEKNLIKTAVLQNFTTSLPTGFERINTDIKDRMFVLL